MTLEEAVKHLLDNEWLQEDGTIYCLGTYICVNESFCTLDGDRFTTKDLMALAVYCEAQGWHKE